MRALIVKKMIKKTSVIETIKYTEVFNLSKD